MSASPSPTPSKSLVGLTLVASLLLPACDHESGATNGVEHVLYFSEVKAGDFGGVPIGITRSLTVSRYTSGFEICEPSVSHGGGDCTGGSEEDPLAIESATCETHDCTIEINPERPLVRFSSATPGTTRLRVRVKSKDDDETYTDAVTVRFAEAKRIQLWGEPPDLMPLAMPIARGLSFWAPRPWIVDADGKRLTVDEGLPPLQLEGEAVGPESSLLRLTAIAPGISKLTWRLDGNLQRSVDVEVIEPGAAERLVVLPKAQKSLEHVFVETMEIDILKAQIEAPPLERLARPAHVSGRHYFPVFVVLADGRRAVVPLTKTTLSVPTLVPPGAGPAPWAVEVFPLDSRARGTATLHLEAGAASRDLPLDFE